jgi:hypothetical protein
MSAVAFAAIVAVGLNATPAQAAGEETVDAFSPWQGKGEIHRTGVNTGTFVGSIEGRFFVETDDGPRDAGLMVCPAKLEIDLKTGQQAGSGSCTITGDDGAQVFSRWRCRGVHLVGCDGVLALSGGTGKFAGIEGSGPLTVRTISGALIKVFDEGSSATQLGSGILVLRGFKFTLASQ